MRAAAHDSEQTRARDLAAVVQMQQVSTRLVQAGDFSTLSGEILHAAIEITGADMGNVQLLEDGALRIVAQRGFAAPFLDFFQAVHHAQAASGTAMQSRERVIVGDVTVSPIFAGTPALEVLLAAGVRAVQSTPLVSHTGRVLGMVSTHYRAPQQPNERALRLLDLLARQAADLIERMRAEIALRESEQRFRVMADAAPVLIWMSGTDKLCTWFNQQWLEFVGRRMEQELGNGWTENVHPDDLDRCVNTYVTRFDARRPFSMEYRLRRHDGEYCCVLDSGVPRYDSQGNFAGYIGSAVDITERLRADERFRQVFEAAPNAMIMTDGDGRIVLVNSHAEAVFGYPRGELIGLPVETLIPQRFRGDHAAHWSRFTGDPHRRSMGAGRDLFGRRKDGSELPVEIGLNPIRTAEGLFVVASVSDITERRKAEAETHRLREELTHISRVATMGEAAAAIIHELGQPLTAILTNARAGLRMIASGNHDVEELREILEDIAADDQRADRVIHRLRSLFRKGEAERQSLRLNNVVNDVVAVVRGDAGRKQASIVLDLAVPSPWVSGDRVQLQQVLLNLVVNAFDAMGAVTDRPRKVTVRTRSLGTERVQVDVTDTGPGIAPEVLSSIFEPFVTTKAGGMGMGLSVVHSIVEAHEGQLWAENDPGGGAIFHVVLPAIPAAPQKEARNGA